MSSHAVKSSQCPLCAAEGKDTRKNNLITYSDGHEYCFGGHGLIRNGSAITKFKVEQESRSVITELALPVDCDITYPHECLAWVSQYELNRNDLLNHDVMWSESWKRLIFPVYDGEKGLVLWQGRYFGDNPDKAKWFTQGDAKSVFHILGNSNILILVEDIVSAIKLERAGYAVMPLFGCVVGGYRFGKLRLLQNNSSKTIVWLDEDKRTEAVREAKLGRLFGLDCTVIFSKRDPKDETFESIHKIVLDKP